MNEASDNIFLSAPVEPEDKGMRLDKFLARAFSEISRSQLQRLIAAGCVTCDDDTVADNSFKVRTGDVYQLYVPEAADAEPEAEDIPLEIVYEDADLLVVNKPAGMTVHPAPGARSGTLVNALLWHCRDNLSGIGGVKRPGIVHRIDKDTSGLLVVAKNDLAHQGLCAQFFEHSIERTYYAVVYGLPNPLNGRIEANIGRSRRQPTTKRWRTSTVRRLWFSATWRRGGRIKFACIWRQSVAIWSAISFMLRAKKLRSRGLTGKRKPLSTPFRVRRCMRRRWGSFIPAAAKNCSFPAGFRTIICFCSTSCAAVGYRTKG